MVNLRGPTRSALLTEDPENRPDLPPVPAAGTPFHMLLTGTSSHDGPPPMSASESQCGSATGAATPGLVTVQLGGTDSFPNEAALPALASTGPRMVAELASAPWAAAPAAFAAAPASCNPTRWTPVPKLPADVNVRLMPSPRLTGEVNVLKLLKAVSSGEGINASNCDNGDDAAVADKPDDDAPVVASACSCCGTLAIS